MDVLSQREMKVGAYQQIWGLKVLGRDHDGLKNRPRLGGGGGGGGMPVQALALPSDPELGPWG